MKSTNTIDAARESAGEQGDLVRRYEKIGISAVAGALACGSKARTTTQAPAPTQDTCGFGERELETAI